MLAIIMLLPMMLCSLTSIIGVSDEPSNGAFINRMNVNTELFENSSVKITIIAEIVVSDKYNGTIGSIAFPIVPIGIAMENPKKGVQDYRPLLGNITVKKIKTESFNDVLLITFPKRLRPGNIKNISFTFTLKPSTALVRLSDSRYRFAYRMYMPNITVYYNTSTMRAILPYGAGITKVGSNGIVEMDSLSGRLTAVWRTFGPPRGAGWDFILEFKILSEAPITTPIKNVTPVTSTTVKKEESFPFLEIAIIIIVSNIITGSTILFLYRKVNKKRAVLKGWTSGDEEFVLDEEDISKYRDLIEKLDRDERSIVDILMSKNGKIEQKELPELTGFSKSKVSRVLKRLDSLGAIRRTSLGKTKMIELNPVLKELLEEGNKSHAGGGI